MCYCDVEPATAWREEWRKARKAFQCCECGAPIMVGDRYHYFSGIWDHQPGHYRTCLECSQVRDFHNREMDRQRECAAAFSTLFDNWPRDQLPAHVAASFAALRASRLSA